MAVVDTILRLALGVLLFPFALIFVGISIVLWATIIGEMRR